MQLIKERQINPIESEVLARISIIRPILTSLLIGIKQDVVDEMGGINNVNSQRNSATAIPAGIFTITVNFTIAFLIPRF